MNKKAIFEIGNIIHVRYKGSYNPLNWFTSLTLTPKEITQTMEYNMFKEENPELCKLAEEDT